MLEVKYFGGAKSNGEGCQVLAENLEILVIKYPKNYNFEIKLNHEWSIAPKEETVFCHLFLLITITQLFLV